MKRTFAILIAAVLCLLMLPVSALAAAQYYVAGEEGLCGNAWAVDDSMNAMTDNGDGTWSITYPGVAAGTYQFKVTAGNWDQSWGKNGQNYAFEVKSDCDVTITFNSETTEITVTGDSVGEVTGIVVDAIRVVGNGSVDWLNGANWDPAADANKMTADGNVYTVTYKDVPAGSDYQFKFAANGSWNDNWGLPEGTALEIGTAMDAVYNAQNIVLSLSKAADVTITLDLSDFDYSSKGGAKLTVAVKEISAEPAPTEEQKPTEGEPAADTRKVYAHIPASWSAPGVWAWDDNQKNAFDAWPGLSMTEGEGGWWTAEVPAWIQNIIINGNGGSAQTADLDVDQQADMWIVVAEDNSAVIYYEEPDLGQVTPPTEETQPTTEATQPTQESTEATEATQPSGGEEPSQKPGTAATVVQWVVVLLVSAGLGCGAVLVIHRIRTRKK